MTPRIAALTSAAAMTVLTAACLFGAAGQIGIAGFWVYLGLMALLFVVSIALLDPALVQERMRPGGKALPLRLWALQLLMLAHFVVAGIDRGRIGWLGSVSLGLQALGFILLATSWALMIWAMRVNPFFSSVARLQPDRGQRVISTGPYRVVRHPGYLAGLILPLGSGLALGSWAAAAFVFPALPLVLWRAIAEDRMLLAGLPGYAAYAARVRWRVMPGLW